MKNLIRHIKLVSHHRRYVCNMCFKMGIPFQGIIHDLSKYSIRELRICKYYTGSRSPHDNARDELGYSPSWIHHKYKNKHHWQYWIDDNHSGDFVAIKIPYKYVVEQFCDMVGASKAYLKDKYTHKSPYKYYLSECKGKRTMHTSSEALLIILLQKMAELDSEVEFFEWYKDNKHILKYLYTVDKFTLSYFGYGEN